MKNNISVAFFAKTILTEYSKTHKENENIFFFENENLIASEAIFEYVKKHDFKLYKKIQLNILELTEKAILRFVSENT